MRITVVPAWKKKVFCLHVRVYKLGWQGLAAMQRSPIHVGQGVRGSFSTIYLNATRMVTQLATGMRLHLQTWPFSPWLRIRSKPSCAKARALLSRHACTGLPTTIFWNLFQSVYVSMPREKPEKSPKRIYRRAKKHSSHGRAEFAWPGKLVRGGESGPLKNFPGRLPKAKGRNMCRL